MIETNTVVLGVLIVLAFIWRFVRTRQLYLISLAMQISGSDPISFNPKDLRSFIDQSLLGHRSIAPNSFFIRAVVFLLVAICLLPFKDYDPILFWFVVLLIVLYIPWCLAHGFMLRKQIVKSRSS